MAERGVFAIMDLEWTSWEGASERRWSGPGEEMEIGFNSRYLLDITSQFDGDISRFALADAVSPTIVSDLGDERALYVLMPMRV